MMNQIIITDDELIKSLKVSSDKLDILYLKHKDYCINFLLKIHDDKSLITDIYHDAVIICYEKIIENKFVLTASIQTYLNSICKNQLLKQLDKHKLSTSILDSTTEQTDWYEDAEISELKLKALNFSLEKLKSLGGKCYEILKKYFYDNLSMQKIAVDMGYTNAENVKNQKARCQKKLNQFAITFYNKINA